MITVVSRRFPASDLYESGGGAGIEALPRRLLASLEDRLKFVSQAEVHGDRGPDAIVVLNEEREIFVMQIPDRLSHENGGA